MLPLDFVTFCNILCQISMGELTAKENFTSYRKKENIRNLVETTYLRASKLKPCMCRYQNDHNIANGKDGTFHAVTT